MAATVEDESRPGEAYLPGGAWDEACEPSGHPREQYGPVMKELAGADLGRLSRDVAGYLADAGVTFGAGEGSPFRVDPVPRILASAEWARVEAGVAQRARALAAFVSDVYGSRRIVECGRLPARVIDTAGHLEPWMRGVEPAGAGYVAGLDLVRGADGELRVLEDNIRTPSGLAYVLAARAAVDAQLPVDPPAGRCDPSRAYGMLGRALREAAPPGVSDPLVVLLTDGSSNSAWWEHRQIARGLGVPLLTPPSLSARGGRLEAMIDGATRQVDVVYRRTDEDRLRDAAGRPTWVADLLLEPVRRGSVAVVNPLGCGVADDKLVHAYVEEMVSFYLDEEPLLRSVPTHDLGDPETREWALANIGDLVVKPRGGLGGQGIVIGPQASEDDIQHARERVTARPDEWVAQELVSLSTHPTVCHGALEPRHVDLRPYAVGGGAGGFGVVPGALTRVAFDRGNTVVNSSQNGGGKDTWVIA